MGPLPTDDPVVSSLFEGANLARLSYIGLDGRPRVVPIWFAHADGDIIMITGPKAQKARALAANGAVALSIDSDQPPYKVLLIDGDAQLEHVEGMALPRVKQQVRIRVAPRSWRIFDFMTRRPKSLS